ncbi:MAG TPA: glycosyl hydrolase family 18 protein [Kiritimatiellia bacterium]|nr:glycosyl hydrolase family 18 protein [Kiritimatiellia bacterium]HMO98788.1 glycosyl hydrolase family 18 protein [Kiritimatiellia bacterium]HMP96879.1 glycosyl hydrolase family 18 protein [Kiritimatiellia bacterium]
MITLKQILAVGLLMTALHLPPASGAPEVARHRPILTGYWHNWNSPGRNVPLRDVPAWFDHVHIAFAFPVRKNSGEIIFTPYQSTPDAFRADLRRLQQRGAKVILSLGGGNHPIELKTPAMRDAFVRSVNNLITLYGFDGIDLNLEGASIILDKGDTNFRRPTTPKIVHMIEAVKELRRRRGPGFIITAAPETRPVTGAYGRYGVDSGGWLPLLHHLRNELNLVHFQLYNSGTQYALIRKAGQVQHHIVKQGTPEFAVGLAEMLILGFPIAMDPKNVFPGLGAEKVSLGFPAYASEGFQKPSQVRQIVDILQKGDPRNRFHMRQPSGHPRLGGVMMWSINWDYAAKPVGSFPLARAIKTP